QQILSATATLTTCDTGKLRRSRLNHMRLLDVLLQALDADQQAMTVEALVVLARSVQHVLGFVVSTDTILVLCDQDTGLAAKRLQAMFGLHVLVVSVKVRRLKFAFAAIEKVVHS